MACDKTQQTQRQSAWNALAEECKRGSDLAKYIIPTGNDTVKKLPSDSGSQTQKHLVTVTCACTLGRCCRTSHPALASPLPAMHFQAVILYHTVLSSSVYLLYIALACCSLPSQPCRGSAPMSPAPPCLPHQAASSGLIPKLPCLASSWPGTRSRLLDWL